MTAHKFGGPWTVEKLDKLKKYLAAYMKIFSSNPSAKLLKTIYVDAFAGTGYRANSTPSDMAMIPDLEETETKAYLKGSAVIALETIPSFSRYVFIEQKASHVKELEQLKVEFPKHTIQILQGDANSQLDKLIGQVNWQTNRAVVFLDPYGMQIEWKLIKAIAATKAIDLWMLFPLGTGVNRLLTRKSEPPEEWARALTRIFGTEEWRDQFYQTLSQETLFGREESLSKSATFDSISRFLVQRLETAFPSVAPHPLPLMNSRGNPLYLLCFASGNARGGPTALKIARHILEN